MTNFTESARQWAEHTLPAFIERQWNRIPESVRIGLLVGSWAAVSGFSALLVMRGVVL
jgi:hypothetical protein